MTDCLQSKKSSREKKEENLVPLPTTPNMAENPEISASPSLEIPASFHDEKQPQQQPHSSPIARIHPLRLRELGKTRSLPNIYKDYHVHTFPSVKMGFISFMVAGVDIILLVHSYNHVLLFKRERDEISPACWKSNGNPITFHVGGHIKSVCYNYHDNTFLIAYEVYQQRIHGWGQVDIISLEIAPIQAGGNPMVRRLFPGNDCIIKWGFDVPICRAMIYDEVDHHYKFFELKEYRVLFTIPDVVGHTLLVGSGGTPIGSSLKCLSPGNMEMVMYEELSSTQRNGRLGIELKIYSKLNGILQKVVFVPRSSKKMIEFVVLCGSNTLLVQQHSSQIEVVKMCDENPDSVNIRNTNIRATYEPYYLHKRAQFICYTELKTIHVCNVDGEILVTLEDHPLVEDPDLMGHSYISNSHDVLISLCCRWLRAPSGERWIFSVNVSSIVTGECLAKITSEDPNSSKIRKAVLTGAVTAFGYDERTHQIFTGNGRGFCGVWSNKFHNDAGDVSIQVENDPEEE